MKTRLIIRHRWALGDTVLLTALIRDIHRAHPDQYEIKVDTHWTNVWWNNPYVSTFEEGSLPRPTQIEVSWGDAIKWNAYARFPDRREMKHILAWYHYDFEKKTGIRVPVTDPRPDLHMTDEEKKRRIQGRYWVVVSGGKLDATTKHWHAYRMQEVVDKLREHGIACVQTGAAHTNHIHPPLKNVVNMIGKTENVRDLWNLILHSDGVICGITGAMHIAAALEKPCVVYAGGREEPWFEAYVNDYQAFGPTANPVRVEHRYLHTIGKLECCDKQGCWKNRVVPLDPQDLTRNVHRLCRNPIRPAASHPVAACQDLIQVDQVVEAVMSYYDKKELPDQITIPQVELIQVSDTLKVIREPSVESKKQQPYQTVHPLEITQQNVGTIQRSLAIMDNPIIGGKLTVCVLCYGPHTNLAKKCLSSILASVPAHRLDIRVGTNQIVPETLDYLKTLPITKIYVNSENRCKYPVMRDMFWDDQAPINTNYVVWFDDDTWIASPDWITSLCKTIVDNHNYNYRLYGTKMYHDLSIYRQYNPDRWFKAADWYKGKHFRQRGSASETPNGSVIDFAVGWCWAMATEAIRAANIPDVRLHHNGGDITIGEQIHQAGFDIMNWNAGKKMVACPARENGGRRGYSERFPWDLAP